eukprot:scaffold4028_cov217-Alexandrium_tamarense.AAC.11
MNRLLPLLAFLLAGHTGADEYTHKYKAGDKVDLWVNKVCIASCSVVWRCLYYGRGGVGPFDGV